MTRLLAFAIALLACCVFPVFAAAERYELDAGYAPVLPAGMKLGAISGLAVDAEGGLVVAHRGPRPILVYDAAGKLVHIFGDEEITAVHGCRVDPDHHIWVTDYKNHTVIKYSPAGKRLLVLGQRDMPGADGTTFNRATDVAFGANGDFFVSDGYGNNRIVKFTMDGKFIKAWGTKGKAEGQLHLPHCVQVDGQGLLHVGDRENNRVQVFDQDGTIVRSYGGFAPYGMCLTAEQTLLIADGRANKCLHMTLDGKVLAEWGAKGAEPGQFDLPHCLAADRQGNIYVGEINGQRLQRFVHKHREQ